MSRHVDIEGMGLVEVPDDATPDEVLAFANQMVAPKPEPTKIQLNPLQQAQMQTGMVNPASSRNQGEAISPDEQAAASIALNAPSQVVTAPFNALGKVGNAAVQDAATTLTGHPEFGGNLVALWNQKDESQPLPYQQTLSKISQSNPVLATAGKMAATGVESLPIAAAVPTGAMGRLASIGFSADMFKAGGEAALVLNDELGKPPGERDHDRLTTALSTLATSAVFAPLAAKHGIMGDVVSGKVAPDQAAQALLNVGFRDRTPTVNLPPAPAGVDLQRYQTDPAYREQVSGVAAPEVKPEEVFPLAQQMAAEQGVLPPQPISAAMPSVEATPGPLVPAPRAARDAEPRTPPAEPGGTISELKGGDIQNGKEERQGRPEGLLTPETPPSTGVEPIPPERQALLEKAAIAGENKQYDLMDAYKKAADEISPAPVPPAEAAGAMPATPGAGVKPLKTKLDRMLDGVERTGKELTIEVTDANRENLTRIIGVAERRGLNASTDGRFVLVRKAEPKTQLEKLEASGKAPEQVKKLAERVKLKSQGPQTFTVEERLTPTPVEAANGEQPLRVRNERTGETSVVLEGETVGVGKKGQNEPSGKPNDGLANSGVQPKRADDGGGSTRQRVRTGESPSGGPLAQPAGHTDQSPASKVASDAGEQTELRRAATTPLAPASDYQQRVAKILGHENLLTTLADARKEWGSLVRLDQESSPFLDAQKDTLRLAVMNRFEVDRTTADKIVADLVRSSPSIVDAIANRVPVSQQMLNRLGMTRPSQMLKWGYEKEGAKWTTKPAPMHSMGGLAPSDPLEPVFSTPQLKQLASTVEAAAGKIGSKEAFNLGAKVQGAKDAAKSAMDGLALAGKAVVAKLKAPPKWTDWQNILGDRQLELSESIHNAVEFKKRMLSGFPDEKVRAAISNWVDTGGNAELLAKAAKEGPEQYRAGYEQALKLTPEQKTAAENIRNYFDARLKEAQDAGILEDGIEDYIHRIYEKDSDWKRGLQAQLSSGLYTGTPTMARQRVFEYDMEAEAAGYKPVKDFVHRIVAYDTSLNKAIADRAAVKKMMKLKGADGRPAVDVGGLGTPIEGKTPENAGALLIKPDWKPNDQTTPANNRGDYIPLDHPALRKWKWVAEVDGKPVLVQGQVLIHPEFKARAKALLGRSAVKENVVGRTMLKVSSAVKQTMLDLSAFHPAQISVHAAEHGVFKPIDRIDFADPVQRELIKHGVTVADTHGQQLWSEGLAGSSLTRHIPVLGEKLQAWNEYVFTSFIPRIKMAMAMKAVERNRARYADELKSGKMTEDDLYYLTANQANAAFGELNYELMSRNKTTQDVLRLGLLAPDFLEARGRFVGQALKPYGREQFAALAKGAIALYVASRVINKILDDQYHFEPENAFSVIYNGHAYSLRTVQGDLIHLVTSPGQFWRNRLNPVYGRTTLEFLTGRDEFGRKRDYAQQAGDLAKQIVPISGRGLIAGPEQKLLESALGAVGITNRRFMAGDTILKLAQDFREKNGKTAPGEFIYDRDKDPYRGIKLAALYEHPADVAAEIAKLRKEKPDIAAKLGDHFRRYANSPFTGSAEMESRFKASLSEDQLKDYELAKQERQRVYQNYLAGASLPVN